KELAERSKDADIVMNANNPYPKEAFQQAKNLKLINVAFTGVDHVDEEAAKAQNIQIANAAGSSNTAVHEPVLGLTLDALRSMSRQSIKYSNRKCCRLFQYRGRRTCFGLNA